MADITKANEQIAAWDKNLERLKNGEFGAYKNSEESIETLLRYWKAQAEAGYPSASDNVRYFEQLIEKRDLKQMDKLNFGLKECSKCEYNLRCQECIYNKSDISRLIADARADTVKKMQEEARQRCFMVGDEEFVALYDLDQIAKEMLEGV